MALDYNLEEYRELMALLDAASEAWTAYADPDRNSLATIRRKNQTRAAFGRRVADLLRELQTYRLAVAKPGEINDQTNGDGNDY